MRFFLAILCCAAACAAAPPAEVPADGKALFEKHCAMCHKPTTDNRTPTSEALKKLPNQAIVTALETGAMKSQGAALKPNERQAIADFLVGKAAIAETAPQNACPANSPALSNLNGWNGWGVDLVNTRMQSTESGGIRAEDVPKLKVKWAFGFPGVSTVFGQPTAVGGRLFLGSDRGTVYSLDARTGCVYWTFKATVQVRSPITVAPITGSEEYAAYFGDGQATVYAVNAQTGELLWKTKIEDHKLAGITGGPKVYGGRVYVGVRSGIEEMVAASEKYACCTFRGSLAALDAKTGKLEWKTYTIPDPPSVTKKNSSGTELYGPSGAAIWSSPTIDVKRKAIYVGTGNNYSDPHTRYGDAVIAFDLETGSMRWVKQMNPDVWNYSCSMPGKANCPEAPDGDTDIGASPILKTLPGGKDILLIGQKSAYVYGIDPDKRGEILWKLKIGKGGALGGVLWGMAADSENVYVPLSDIVPGPGGGLFALKIASGEKIWSAEPEAPPCKGKFGCSQAQMAPVTLIPGVVFSGSMDGHLRAYSTSDGKVVWDLDTLHDFETVNGVKAHGGSMNATGPTLAGGMLFVNSGYSQIMGMGGNVLLALSVDGK